MRRQKHNWTFQGLVSCGHCGCALTAEIKKGRLIYYHCTGHKGKCPEKWVREEELDRQFRDALAAIAIDERALVWIGPPSKKATRTRSDMERSPKNILTGKASCGARSNRAVSANRRASKRKRQLHRRPVHCADIGYAGAG